MKNASFIIRKQPNFNLNIASTIIVILDMHTYVLVCKRAQVSILRLHSNSVDSHLNKTQLMLMPWSIWASFTSIKARKTMPFKCSKQERGKIPTTKKQL